MLIDTPRQDKETLFFLTEAGENGSNFLPLLLLAGAQKISANAYSFFPLKAHLRERKRMKGLAYVVYVGTFSFRQNLAAFLPLPLSLTFTFFPEARQKSAGSCFRRLRCK